ncbi:MAG TPA: hypothetical protein VIK74_06310 [Parasegetibacter sp.]
MQFNEVYGQETTQRHLVEMVQQNRLGHALLFLGKEGSGALPLAIAFAKYLVCTGKNKSATESNSLFADEPGPDSASLPFEPCGTCPACVKAEGMIHPDIHFSYPVIPRKAGDKPLSTDFITEWREFIKQLPYGNVYDWLQFIGAENKQGNITAHECNEINRKINLKSFESEFKILIMWMPEYLGTEGNKLLKLIEEPPANTVFILVAENESQMLQTILSRCQLIKIPVPDNESITRALMEKSGLDLNKARQIAAISDGNYREALRQVQHAEEDWQDLLREWLNSILKSGPVAQVKWIDEISRQGREKQKQFLRYFNHLLEQSIRLEVMGQENLHISESETDFANRINKIADISQQQAIVEELDRSMYYIERNANSKLLFHALTIKLYHIIRNKSLFLVK